jgi:predicted transposase YbfD/YdcC
VEFCSPRDRGEQELEFVSLGCFEHVRSQDVLVLCDEHELSACRRAEHSQEQEWINPKCDSEQIARFIRSDWGIENSLHYVLNFVFHKNNSRHRTRNLAANLSTLRHMATSLLKIETTSKLGIANKRKKAGRNRDYLLRVLSDIPSAAT